MTNKSNYGGNLYSAGSRQGDGKGVVYNKGNLTELEIIRLMRDGNLRLMDEPATVNLAGQLIASPDIYLTELFAIRVHEAAAKAMISDDVFRENYPIKQSIAIQPDMVVCGVMPTGDPIILNPDRLFCNMGVFGRTGAGKTSWLYLLIKQILLMTTSKNNTLILVFQQKEEYSDWATDPELNGKVLPLRAGDFKISVFQESDGVTHRHHVHTFFDDFARSYSRMSAQRLGEDVEETESKKLPKKFYLPWTIFTEKLEFQPGHGYVENRYRESMLYACKDWKNCFGDIFDYYRSDMLDMLYDWLGLCTITIDAPIAASTALITTIVRYLQNKSKQIYEAGGIPKAIDYVIEDATVVTDESELGNTTSPLVPMSFISRVYRQGFIFSGHNISTSFSKKLLSNLESIVVFGISESPKVIQNLIICSESQAQLTPTLKPGQFISLIPSFHPHAVLGKYPFVQPPRKLTEAERQDIVGPFIEKVKAVKFIERALPAITVVSTGPDIEKSKNFRLQPNELQLLIAAGTGKLLTKTQLYSSLKLNRRSGKKNTDNLEKKGLIRTHTFGKFGFIEVLGSGKDAIRYIGLKPKEAKGGGFEHTVGVELVEDDQKKLGNSTKLEVDILGNRIDLESSNSSSGQKIFFNIGVSDPIREAKNTISILKTPAVKNNRFVFVARDSKFVSEVKKALKQYDPTGAVLNQIEIKAIADYVEK